MDNLPPELIEKLCNLLSIKDICSLSLLSRHWHTIGSIKLYYYPVIRNEKSLTLFTKISKKCQHYIRKLDFTSVHPFVTDMKLSRLLENSNNIKHINLSKCIHVSPTTLHKLLENNLNHLDTLILADCTLSTDILSCIGKANHQRLKTLDLSNTMIKPCTAIDSCHELKEMITLPFLSSQLVCLDLSYCGWVNSQTVENIAYGLPKLEKIVLQWCNKVKLVSFRVLIRKLEDLKFIDLRHIDSIASAEQISMLVEGTRSLKKVLFTCKRVNAQITLE